MESTSRRRLALSLPYAVMFAVNLAFLIFAFAFEDPASIYNGFIRIISSRSILVTDYIAIGGLGATLLNVAIAGLASLIMLVMSRIKPGGAVIMALWLTAGFAFFGKNVFNMIPLTIGVWAYSRYQKEPFSSYALASLLVATLSPIISEMSFFGVMSLPIEVAIGVLIGFGVGFIFPPITAHMVRMHSGYDLYSMGFAGGLIATIIASIIKSMGYDIIPVYEMSSGNNTIIAIMLYTISVALLCCGLLAGGENSVIVRIRKNLGEYPKFFKHSGRLITDFYFLYSNSIYINMGLLCAFATTVVLLLGAEFSGIVIAGVLTIVGFGCFGKHPKNVTPVMIGAFLSALLNKWELTCPQNVAAILFSTALAPMAGQFGWLWGIVSGFLHVCIAMFVGELNGGLNLYNNGFSAGLVAMFLLPVIHVSKRMRIDHED